MLPGKINSGPDTLHSIQGEYGLARIESFDREITKKDYEYARIKYLLDSRQVLGENVVIFPSILLNTEIAEFNGYTQTYSGGILNPKLFETGLGYSVSAYRLSKPLDEIITKKLQPSKKRTSADLTLKKNFKKFLKKRLEGYRGTNSLLNFEGLGDIDKFLFKFCQRLKIREVDMLESLGTARMSSLWYEDGIGKNQNCWLVIEGSVSAWGFKISRYWGKRVEKGYEIKKDIKSAEKEIKQIYQGQEQEIKEKLLALHKSKKYQVPPSKFLVYPSDLSGYLEDILILQTWAEYNHFYISQRLSKMYESEILESVFSMYNFYDPIDGVLRKGAAKAKTGNRLILPVCDTCSLYEYRIYEGISNLDWNFSGPCSMISPGDESNLEGKIIDNTPGKVIQLRPYK